LAVHFTTKQNFSVCFGPFAILLQLFTQFWSAVTTRNTNTIVRTMCARTGSVLKKAVPSTGAPSTNIKQIKAKFQSPRRFSVLAHEDLHRASYRRSLTGLRKVRFAPIVQVARQQGSVVLEPQDEASSLWHSDADYAAFRADILRTIERYRQGHRSDELLGLEHFLCPRKET
jgi:hypothetical protein